MPSGTELVFDGRTSPSAAVNLFTVGIDGIGLRPLTEDGGSQPAPCSTGAIAFVKHGDVYLLARDRRSQRRLTFRAGNDPDCSPDGHTIAFVRRGAVYTIGTDGRHLRRVASSQTPRRQIGTTCATEGACRAVPPMPSSLLPTVAGSRFSPTTRGATPTATFSRSPTCVGTAQLRPPWSQAITGSTILARTTPDSAGSRCSERMLGSGQIGPLT